MKENFENHRLRTCMWIVSQLRRRPMSLRELNERWVDDDDLSAGMPIERRTFFNYVRAIADLFQVEIECDRHDGFRYHIAFADRDRVRDRMISDFEQQLALQQATGLKGRIMIDQAPLGHDELLDTVRAMNSSHMLDIEYRNFNSPTTAHYHGAPYALRCYQQRWYVVLRTDEGMRVLSLDRMEQFEVCTDETFEMDPTFSVEEYFRHSFGIRVDESDRPMRLVLRVAAVQCPYMRSLPLHHSQRETETHPEYSLFSLCVRPSVELTMKLLSMGRLVEVMEPPVMRRLMSEEARLLHEVYEGKVKSE